MRALQYVLAMSVACGGFFSMERPCTKATNSEIRRWMQSGVKSAVVINGQDIHDPNMQIELPVRSFVLFPNSTKRRITLL